MLLRTALLLATVIVPNVVMAQDLVMRRPLPNARPLNQTSVPSDPTPTPDPGPGDGFDSTPTSDPGDPPPSTYGYYYWDVGRWSGSPQCGVQSTITRSVSCIYSYYDPALRRSFDKPVTSTYCSSDPDAGPMPVNRYVGTGGGCGYHVVEHPGEWEPGTDYLGRSTSAVCSNEARRPLRQTCETTAGVAVPLSYCTQGLSSTGDGLPAPVQEYEYGNFAGCTYSWKMGINQESPYYPGYQGTKLYGDGAYAYHYCGQRDDDQGTSGVVGSYLYVNEAPVCRRSDGAYADDASCSGPRPPSGPRLRGRCHPAFHVDGTYNDNQLACMEEDGGKVLDQVQTADRLGNDHACDTAIAGGATCCSVRRVDNRFDQDAYRIIATTSPRRSPTGGQGSYRYSDAGQVWSTYGASGIEYNPNSCDLTNEDGEVIYRLQPWQCF